MTRAIVFLAVTLLLTPLAVAQAPAPATSETGCQATTTDLERDARFAAVTASAEARASGREAMLLVLEVIANRVCAGRYGGRTAEAVVTQPWQFSPWSDATLQPRLLAYALNLPSGRRSDLERLADEILPSARTILSGHRSGRLPSRGEDAVLHFANLKLCNPAWARRARQVLEFGGHTFFAGVDRPIMLADSSAPSRR